MAANATVATLEYWEEAASLAVEDPFFTSHSVTVQFLQPTSTSNRGADRTGGGRTAEWLLCCLQCTMMMRPMPVYEYMESVEASDSEGVERFFQENKGRHVRLPVTIKYEGMSRECFVGTRALVVSDSRMGVGLEDHSRRQDGHFYIEGDLDDNVLEMTKFGGVAPKNARLGTIKLE